jgi:two-component system cell cycle response regulator
LVVDDDPLNVKLLAVKLPQDQYEVIKAYSGKEAIEKAAAESLDLILLDIMMPGMDGYEVTRSLKSDPITSDIPIILISSLDGAEEKVKGLEAGADEFINKPFNAVELRSRVKSLIRLKQYREQLATRAQSKAVFDMAMGSLEVPEEKTVVPSVLVVEDNPNDARLIQEYLKGSSFRVELANDGEEALARAEKNKIDLILLDILLPAIDGLEVCRRLKESEQTRDVQILMVSCLSDMENKIKSLQVGADDFLVKPVNPHELKARVKALLKKKDSLDRLKGSYETLLHTAITDNLTGLDNCAYFRHFLELEIKRSQRHKYPLALIMMDIDDFKLLNDTLGHPGGDTILRELGRLIRSNFREIDFVARYEEDKFAIALSYCNGIGAAESAERVKQIINAHSFLRGTCRPPKNLTVSMGVAESSASLASAEELIQRADEALYRAKKEGKDRVCFSN